MASDKLLPAFTGAGIISWLRIRAFEAEKRINSSDGHTLKELVSAGLISEQEVARAASSVYGVPLVDLSNRFNHVEIDIEVLSLLSGDLARFFVCLPFRTNTDGHTVVAMTDMPDETIRKHLEEFVGEFEVAIATESSIRSAINRHYPAKDPKRLANTPHFVRSPKKRKT